MLGSAQRLLGQVAMPHMQDPKQMPKAPEPTPPRVGPPMFHTLGLAPFVDALPLPEMARPVVQQWAAVAYGEHAGDAREVSSRCSDDAGLELWSGWACSAD